MSSYQRRGKLEIAVTLCFWMYFSLAGRIQAQAFPRLVDPLFGIEFNPEKVHLQIAPASIGLTCEDLRNRRLWVFAHSASEGKNYYVVNGYFRNSEADPPTYESDFGVGIVLEGSRCTVMPADRLMSGGVFDGPTKTKERIAEAVLHDLSSDALHRMTAAFGSKNEFKAQLSRAVAAHDAYEAKLPPSLRSDYPPVVRQSIDEFLKDS